MYHARYCEGDTTAAILQNVELDCFVPRNDGFHGNEVSYGPPRVKDGSGILFLTIGKKKIQ